MLQTHPLQLKVEEIEAVVLVVIEDILNRYESINKAEIEMRLEGLCETLHQYI